MAGVVLVLFKCLANFLFVFLQQRFTTHNFIFDKISFFQQARRLGAAIGSLILLSVSSLILHTYISMMYKGYKRPVDKNSCLNRKRSVMHCFHLFFSLLSSFIRIIEKSRFRMSLDSSIQRVHFLIVFRKVALFD